MKLCAFNVTLGKVGWRSYQTKENGVGKLISEVDTQLKLNWEIMKQRNYTGTPKFT